MAVTWWDENAINQLKTLEGWIGNHTAPSKVEARRHVAQSGYKSILDVGCGLCSEYAGYKADGYEIEWRGVDSCADLVNLTIPRMPFKVTKADAELLPFPDKFFDVVYIRHVLEHLKSCQAAIREAVRVARKEVLIVWFLRPTYEKASINYDAATT